MYHVNRAEWHCKKCHEVLEYEFWHHMPFIESLVKCTFGSGTFWWKKISQFYQGTPCTKVWELIVFSVPLLLLLLLLLL